jgi:hypothetical protein
MKKNKFKEALEDMVNQFAFTLDNPPRITAGGLSALEHAFIILGYPDPKDMPERKCQYGRCKRTATSGTPTKKGYRRVCGQHFSILSH